MNIEKANEIFEYLIANVDNILEKRFFTEEENKALYIIKKHNDAELRKLEKRNHSKVKRNIRHNNYRNFEI